MIGQGEGAYSSWHGTGLEWPEGDENWSAPWLQPTPLQASLHISRKVSVSTTLDNTSYVLR